MKLKYYNKTALAVLILSFLMSSCRSVESGNSENIIDPPVSVGDASVVVNLLGSEFVESDGNNPQASTGKQLRNPQAKETYYTLTSPSTLLAAEVSEDTSVPLNTSAGINPVAVVDGDPLVNGTKFRLIAYKMDGSYAGSKDFAVGTTSTSGLRLPKGVPYWMVVYSYGTNYLSGISPSETMSLGNAKHTYDNMVGQNGFLYQIQMFTPQEGDNTMSVVLRHKIAQVTTKINSSALSAPNNITSVTSAKLIGNNQNAEFNLSNGSTASRSTSQNVETTFGQSPSTEWTSNAVFINADSPVNKTISFSANIAINNQTAKPVTITNGFSIKPGYRTTYKINLKETKCGAYLGTTWREFACYNVGADTNTNPFIPVKGNHGGKVQWGHNQNSTGRYIDQTADQNTPGKPIGWVSTNSTSDWEGGANNPCENGYRVPTKNEWEDFVNTYKNSTDLLYTSLPWNNGSYTNAIFIQKNGKKTLMLPITSIRSASTSLPNDGTRTNVGIIGFYWSSTIENGATGIPFHLNIHIPFGENKPIIQVVRGQDSGSGMIYRIHALPVRCIKKLSSE
ncbi:hypothetical protein [Elizabethkingia anophelis]|uniref:hypothetical protein n=1 Tax=Elizabethkingia anophelis TaxID=1117645 RepID=UPI00038A3202|nr:hypothetical protein [Elizabethkingia anophelis]EQB91693.1 hypothetical protein C874_10880 [Elizabethkingia anophelis 502]